MEAKREKLNDDYDLFFLARQSTLSLANRTSVTLRDEDT